jgi:hypothetical protein
VYVAFDRDDWPLASDTRREITLGARAAYVQEGTSGWPDACQVQIAYRHTGAFVETVELYVEQADTTPAENCPAAESLARVVNDRLPR